MSASESANTGGTVLEQVGDNIIHHVSNTYTTDPEKFHPIIHFPKLFEIEYFFNSDSSDEYFLLDKFSFSFFFFNFIFIKVIHFYNL